MGSKISIITPAYNAEKTIIESIESVICQSYENWELVIIDDKSTDNTKSIITQYANKNPKIKPIFLEKNSGKPAFPRNIGLKYATGSYIAFLDADDVWKIDKLEQQIKFMESQNISFSYTGYEVINSEGVNLGSLVPPEKIRYDDAIKINNIGCLTVMIKSTLLKDKKFPNCGHEDYALWLEILKEGTTAFGIQQRLATYRLQSSSISSNKLKVLAYFFNIYHKIEMFGLFKSIFYTLRYAWHARHKYRN